MKDSYESWKDFIDDLIKNNKELANEIDRLKAEVDRLKARIQELENSDYSHGGP